MGLIFADLDIASSWDVPFHHPQLLQHMFHGSTEAHHYSPLYSIPFSTTS